MFIGEGPWRTWQTLPSTTRSSSSLLLMEMDLLLEVEFQWNTGEVEVEAEAVAEGGVLEGLVEELSMLELCCTMDGCNVPLVLEAMFKLDFKGELKSSR